MNDQTKKNISDNEKNKNEENENELLCHKFNLFQQFFIIGLDSKILNLLKNTDFKSIPEPLIGPKIITKYPNISFPYLNIPDSLVISHCFPKGFKNSIIQCDPIELKEKQNLTYDFIFSFDNYQMDKESSLRINKVYYICYLFYEKFEDYITCMELKLKKKNEKKKYYLNRNILIPKVICISTFSPLFLQSKLLLHYLKVYVDIYSYNNIKEKIYNNSHFEINNEKNLPLEKVIEGYIYNLPVLPRANFFMKIGKNNFMYGDELREVFDNNMNEEEEIIFENSFANKKPKPIINYSLLMKFFKIEEIFEIIKLMILEEPILFFCDNIEYLTYTIEGLLALIYPFEYQYPVMSILPEQNYSFINLYNHFIFGINHAYSDNIFILKGINLDGQKNVNIVIIENRFNNILNGNEKEKSKTSVILNVKPNNSKFLQISYKSINKAIDEIKELYIKRKNMIGTNKEEEKIEDEIEIKKIKLPVHYYVKCCKKFENNLETRLKELKSKMKDMEKDKNSSAKLFEKEKEKAFNDEITEIFLYFFTSIFLHYQEFCVKFRFLYDTVDNGVMPTSKKGNSKIGKYARSEELEKKYYTNKLTINDLFSCDLYIDEMPSFDRPFYIKFLKTKIFFNFMKKKIFPISTQDKLDILFFDDKINEKLSREVGMKKVESKFLEYNDSNMNSELKIGCLSKPFSDNFKEILFDQKNRDKALNYFQYVVLPIADNNNNNESNDTKNANIMDNYNSTNNNNIDIKFNFYYFVFPKLLNDGLFYKGYQNEDESKNLWSSSNFICKNCDCLYNQFEKEGNNILNDENFVKNYSNYYYSFNTVKLYSRPYDHYVKNLFLLFFAKVFNQIPYSKKYYYFNYLMIFMANYKDILDQNSIMKMFNAIIKYGDKTMAEFFFPFINIKTYSIFSILKEKIRPDKNFAQYYTSENKSEENEDINVENSIDQFIRKERSLSGINSCNIRLSTQPLNNERLLSSLGGEEKGDENSTNENTLKKENIFIINDKFNFVLNIFCSNIIDNNICNNPFDLDMSKIFDENKKYIEYKCPKCGKIQELTFSCKYKEDKDDDDNESFIIKSKLFSPATLLENEWFKNADDLNLNYITENYLHEYICSLFYFYNEGLLSDFLIPEKILEKKLQLNNDSNFVLSSQKVVVTHKKEIKKSEGKSSSVDHRVLNFARSSFCDISDQKQSFFEFKADTKKPSLLISANIRKKNIDGKKKVAFTGKNKKNEAQKKNIFSYANFLNKNNKEKV
jgi:hypothetical protein